MAFSEFEQKKIEKALAASLAKRRPAPHIRPELDLAMDFLAKALSFSKSVLNGTTQP